MDAVVSLVCVAGCALGMFLVAVLLLQEGRTHASALLAAVIGVACLGELFSAAEHLSQVAGDAATRPPGFPGLLFAPLSFLYFRALRDGTCMRAVEGWHFGAFVVLQPLALSGAVDAQVLRLGSLLVMIVYALAGIRVACALPRTRELPVFPGGKAVIVAPLMALASYLFGALAVVLLPSWSLGGDLADALLSCAWALLAVSVVRRHLRRAPLGDAEPVANHADVEAGAAPERTKYGNNRLPDFARQSIVRELQRHMQTAQPWRKVDLTLGELAAGVNVSPHHLSQIINSEFGKSFACYINEYRVGEACQLLLGEQGRTVLEVALDSGFSSKSSFNASFKRHTGMTPSEYRKTSQPRRCLVA